MIFHNMTAITAASVALSDTAIAEEANRITSFHESAVQHRIKGALQIKIGLPVVFEALKKSMSSAVAIHLSSSVGLESTVGRFFRDMISMLRKLQ